MKKIIYSLAIAASMLTFNSCIGDLDTVPLNETDKNAGQAYQTLEDFEMGLAYIYGAYSLASQTIRVRRILQWTMQDRANLSANIWC